MCTREDTPAHNLGVLYIDDVMSYNSLTTVVKPQNFNLTHLKVKMYNPKKESNNTKP